MQKKSSYHDSSPALLKITVKVLWNNITSISIPPAKGVMSNSKNLATISKLCQRVLDISLEPKFNFYSVQQFTLYFINPVVLILVSSLPTNILKMGAIISLASIQLWDHLVLSENLLLSVTALCCHPARQSRWVTMETAREF